MENIGIQAEIGEFVDDVVDEFLQLYGRMWSDMG
jgi:hypothetical protein